MRNPSDLDNKFTEMGAKIESLSFAREDKDALKRILSEMSTEVYVQLQDDDYAVFQSEEKKANVRKTFWWVLAAVVFTLVPSYIYISSLHKDIVNLKADNNIPPLEFVPNAIAERKPVYIQMIKTQEQLDAIKNTNIYMKDLVSIGSGVGIGMHGLDIYSAQELKNHNYHLKFVGSQQKQKVIINNYTFIPDTILTKDPTAVQIIYSPEIVKSARKMKNLAYKKYLEVGAVIDCPSENSCNVVSKLKTHKVLVLKPFNYIENKPTTNV